MVAGHWLENGRCPRKHPASIVRQYPATRRPAVAPNLPEKRTCPQCLVQEASSLRPTLAGHVNAWTCAELGTKQEGVHGEQWWDGNQQTCGQEATMTCDSYDCKGASGDIAHNMPQDLQRRKPARSTQLQCTCGCRHERVTRLHLRVAFVMPRT
jgi:hypothetical protein